LFRAFLLKASEGRTAPDFSLKSLAGSGGRMDLICRCVIAALAVPGGPERSTEITIVLEGPPNPPISVTFSGAEIEGAPQGEVEVGEMIAKAMRGDPPRGVRAARWGFREALLDYRRQGFKAYYLHEEGEAFRYARLAQKGVFVLGDHKGLDPGSERLLDELGAKRISLGPISYLASHCITMVQANLP